jgi:hypothetical protein
MAGQGGVIGTVLGWLGYSVGLRDDAASASGSVHGKLKNLWNTVNTKLDKKVSQSGIKSVQRGTMLCGTGAKSSDSQTTSTVTISDVNTAKSFVITGFIKGTGTNTDISKTRVSAVLTNSTTLSLKVTAEDNWTSAEVFVTWQVVEFY